MTTPSTSRHSALSELMIQNAELREQLRLVQLANGDLDASNRKLREQLAVLQSAYDSLSKMREKQVAKRIEADELKEENDSLKAENARLAASCAEMAEACRQICSPIRPHWRATLEAASTALSHYNDGTALNDLLAPTIELLRSEAESANNIRRGRLISEANRLRGLVEIKP